MLTHRRAVEARSLPRLKVFRLACADIAEASFRVHLLDVSEQGARVHAVQAPTRGLRKTVVCALVVMTGDVRWVDANWFGLRFDGRLSPLELEAITSGKSALGTRTIP